MVRMCSVPGCKSESYPNCGISFFGLPNDEALKKKWLDAIPNSKESKHFAVCSNHFGVDDIIIHCRTSNLKARLKPGVVPSVFNTIITPQLYLKYSNEDEVTYDEEWLSDEEQEQDSGLNQEQEQDSGLTQEQTDRSPEPTVLKDYAAANTLPIIKQPGTPLVLDSNYRPIRYCCMSTERKLKEFREMNTHLRRELKITKRRLNRRNNKIEHLKSRLKISMKINGMMHKKLQEFKS